VRSVFLNQWKGAGAVNNLYIARNRFLIFIKAVTFLPAAF